MKRRTAKHYKFDRQRGQQMVEFTAAFVMLVLVFFLPLLDFGILPIRYIMSQQIIQQYARRLSHCETLTQAYEEMDADPSLQTRLIKLGGVNPKSLELHLMISTVKLPIQKIEVIKPKTIPLNFLPEGKLAPCEYILEVYAEIEIAPAMMLNTDANIVGLSKPISCLLRADSPWENLGRNPITKAFFMNE